MQNIIHTYFADYTVISVTHRLDTIIDYDRVLLLENGVLLENDDPRVLLASPSKFRVLYQSSRGWEEYERRERAEQQRRENELAKVNELESEKPTRPPSPDSDMSAEDAQSDWDIGTTIREYWAIVNQMSRLGGTPARRNQSWRNSRAQNRRSQVASYISTRGQGDRTSYIEPANEKRHRSASRNRRSKRWSFGERNSYIDLEDEKPQRTRSRNKRWSFISDISSQISEPQGTSDKKRSWHEGITVSPLPSLRRNSVSGIELMPKRLSDQNFF